MDINYIREKIKSLRLARGITQREMGDRLYMDERTYGKIERGEKKSMDILLLTSIADKLNVSLDVLLVKEKTPGHVQEQDPENTEHTGHIRMLVAAHEVLLEDIQQLKAEIRKMVSTQQEALRTLRHAG